MSIRRVFSPHVARRRHGSTATPGPAERVGKLVGGQGAPTRGGLLPSARRIAWSAAEAILARGGPDGFPAGPGAERCGYVVDSFAQTMASVSGMTRMGVHGLLALLEVLPVVVVGRATRMSRLPLADRIAYLEALEDGRNGLLATLLVGVKVPMSIYAFEDGEPLARTGFDRASTTTTEPGTRHEGRAPSDSDPGTGQEVDR